MKGPGCHTKRPGLDAIGNGEPLMGKTYMWSFNMFHLSVKEFKSLLTALLLCSPTPSWPYLDGF